MSHGVLVGVQPPTQYPEEGFTVDTLSIQYKGCMAAQCHPQVTLELQS